MVSRGTGVDIPEEDKKRIISKVNAYKKRWDSSDDKPKSIEIDDFEQFVNEISNFSKGVI